MFRFHYLYRDAGNYKQFGSVMLPNPGNLSLEDAETSIRSRLFEGLYFRHEEWNVPDLHFERYDPELDHPFHEFVKLEVEDDGANNQ